MSTSARRFIRASGVFPGLLDSVIAAAGEDKALPMIGTADTEIDA